MPRMTAKKVSKGHYVYRNHNVYREEDYCGPEGGARVHWSISGEIGGPDEHSAHAELPQLDSLKGAKHWLDAHLDGRDENGRFCRQIEMLHQPKTWGE